MSDGVEAEGLERFRLTRQYWLGRLRVNPAAATEELKPLERIGPARHGVISNFESPNFRKVNSPF